MKDSTPGFDALCRVLRRNPDFQHARLVEARAKIAQLETRVAEQSRTIEDLAARLSEARQEGADA